MERLLVHCIRLQDLIPLQLAYQEHVRVENAILYMLHRHMSIWMCLVHV